MRRAPELALLGAISALGSLAVHMFVPAMPQAARAFGAQASTLQLAITLYLVGMAIGQLASGSLSDAFGRRPVLLAGVAQFVGGSIVAAAAPTILWLLIGRFLQALGGASALISGRAMVVDRSRGRGAAGDMAGLTTIVLISPALAPSIGGFIVSLAGWRAPLMVLAASGAVLGLVAQRSIAETHAAAPRTLDLRGLLGDWSELLSDTAFMRYAAANALLTVALYMFLTAAPFILADRFALSASRIGLSLLPVACGAIAGASSVRLLERLPAGALTIGKLVCAAASIVLIATTRLFEPSVLSFIGPMVLFAIGTGMTGPSAAAGALSVNKKAIGAASSLLGGIQMALSAVGTLAVGRLGIATPAALSLMLIGPVLLAALLFPVRRGEPPAVLDGIELP